MIKIAFDVGGVITKYPDIFRVLIERLQELFNDVKIIIISDIHPKEKIKQMLQMNDFHFFEDEIFVADYDKYGEACKSMICAQELVDIFVDDFMGYVSPKGSTIRLLVMPDETIPYYNKLWRTDGSEPNFGRSAHLQTDD